MEVSESEACLLHTPHQCHMDLLGTLITTTVQQECVLLSPG